MGGDNEAVSGPTGELVPAGSGRTNILSNVTIVETEYRDKIIL